MAKGNVFYFANARFRKDYTLLYREQRFSLLYVEYEDERGKCYSKEFEIGSKQDSLIRGYDGRFINAFR